MREKLIKLAKRLNEFTLCDMVLLTGIEESIVKGYLDEFLFYKIIRNKDGNRYVFLEALNIKIEEPIIQIKLADAVNEYIQKNIGEKAASTSIGYKVYAKKHIIPYFKNKNISDISPNEVVDFVRHLQDGGYTHRTVEHIFFFLKRVISSHDKSFKFPEIHKLKTPPSLEILSEDEIRTILKAAKRDRYLYPIILGAVTTGLPLGELTAIHWEDVDFENGKIRISKNIFSKARLWRKPPSKIRYIDMPEVFAAELKKWQKIMHPNSYNAVFTNRAGHYHNTNNLRARDFKKILKYAKINDTSFKIIQDSYAVMMIQKNLPLTFIQNQLGHKTVQFTADRYKEFIKTSVEIGFGF